MELLESGTVMQAMPDACSLAALKLSWQLFASSTTALRTYRSGGLCDITEAHQMDLALCHLDSICQCRDTHFSEQHFFLVELPGHCLLHTASRGSHWLVQASLRLSSMQKKQLAVQGRENAAVVTLHQRHCAGIVSALEVRIRLWDAWSPRA